MSTKFLFSRSPWSNFKKLWSFFAEPWFNVCPTVSGLITWRSDLQPPASPIESFQILAERIVEQEVVETRCFGVKEHAARVQKTPEFPKGIRRWMSYKTDCLSPGQWRILPVDNHGCAVYLGEPALHVFQSSFKRPDNRKDTLR